MTRRKAKQKSKSTKKKASFSYQQGYWRSHWLPSLLLFGLAVGIYIQSLPYEFVLDDQMVISDNKFVKQGVAGIDEIFSTDAFSGYFDEQKNLVAGARYRPLSMAMFALEYEAFGLNPIGYHLINVILYGLLCIFMYRVALIYLPRYKSSHLLLGLAFLSSVLYVAHPVHTECVANIKGRDEILSMLGCVALLYMIARYLAGDVVQRVSLVDETHVAQKSSNKKEATTKRSKSDARGSILWIVGAGIIFFLSLFAKENALTFLAVVPLALYFFTKAKIRDYALVLGAMTAATVAYLVVRYSVIGYLLDSGIVINDVMNDPFLGMTAGQKSATIMYTLGEYLRLLTFPLRLTHDYYPYHVPIMEWSDLRSLLSLGLYIILGVVALYGLMRRRLYSFCIIYYIATLSIVSNVVFPIGTFMNERFLFMPSWGYCILFVYFFLRWLPSKIKNPMVKKVGIGIILLCALGYTVRSVTRVPIWKNPLTLNQAAIKVSKNSARANVFIGTALYKQALDEPDRAKKQQMIAQVDGYMDKALSILPQYLNANKMKAGAAAQQFQIDNDADAMLASFKQVAKRRPDVGYIHEYCDFLAKRGRHESKLVDFFLDVGYNILYKDPSTRNMQWSFTYLSYGLQISPNDERLLYAMYLWHRSTNRNDKANEYYRRAVAIDPTIAEKF